MIHLTDDMCQAVDNAVADKCPIMVASAGGDGEPDLAFKGSVMVFDREHLAFWEYARGQTLRNLHENPKICLYYRNPATRQIWKFFGEAIVLDEGDLRQQIMDRTIAVELAHDPERKGAAVYIRVDRVHQRNDVLMRREE